MAAVLAAASYSRIGFSLYFYVRARHVRVPDGSKFHLEPGTIVKRFGAVDVIITIKPHLKGAFGFSGFLYPAFLFMG